MNKIVVIFIYILITSCKSTSQDGIEFETKKVNLPLKILYHESTKDSAYFYLCFPKRIVYNNHDFLINKINRYNLNYHQVGINNRDFRTYKFKDSLTYHDKLIIKPFEKDSLNIYYGYRIKELNLRLKDLIKNKTPVQKKQNWLIYDIPISQASKKWAISKVADTLMKAQLHFMLYNKEKGFFIKVWISSCLRTKA